MGARQWSDAGGRHMADLARVHACPGERAESSIVAARLLLKAVDVAKNYAGIRALANGRLALRAGSVHALCGGNGAGKSTFLSVVMGLVCRDAGRVTLRGTDVDFASPREALQAGIAIIT